MPHALPSSPRTASRVKTSYTWPSLPSRHSRPRFAAPWTVSRNGLGELTPFDRRGRHLLSSEGPLPLHTRLTHGGLIAAVPELFDALGTLHQSILALLRSNTLTNGARPMTVKTTKRIHRLRQALKQSAAAYTKACTPVDE